MRLTVRILGTEIFHLSTDPDEPEDLARDLSGGNLGSERIETERGVDVALGFGRWSE